MELELLLRRRMLLREQRMLWVLLLRVVRRLWVLLLVLSQRGGLLLDLKQRVLLSTHLVSALVSVSLLVLSV